MKKLPYILLLILVSFTSWCQSIPRSTPEAEGVSSAAIQNFIESYKREARITFSHDHSPWKSYLRSLVESLCA